MLKVIKMICEKSERVTSNYPKEIRGKNRDTEHEILPMLYNIIRSIVTPNP